MTYDLRNKLKILKLKKKNPSLTQKYLKFYLKT